MRTAIFLAVATAATCWPRLERTRKKKARSGPGARAAAQAAATSIAGMPAALLGDAAMMGRSRSRLPDAWVKAKIADQLFRRLEPAGVADRGHDCQRDDHVDARDGHDALGAAVFGSRLRKVAFDDLEIVAEAVELAQMPVYG